MKKIFIIMAAVLLFADQIHSQNIDWVRQISSANHESTRGLEVDQNQDIWTLTQYQGTVYYQKNINTSSVVSNGGNDGLLSKYDMNGNIVTTKTFGGTSNDAPYNMTLVNNLPLLGFVYSSNDWQVKTGETLGLSGSNDAVILKLDNSLATEWYQRISSSGSEYFSDIHTDNNGNTYAIGNFTGPVLSIGSTTLTAKATNSHVFLAKFNSQGVLLWAKYINTGSYVYIYSIDTDSDGNIYFGGMSSSWLDIETSSSAYEITTSSNYVGFVAKLDLNGNFIKSLTIPTTNTSRINDLKIFQDKMYVGGYMASTAYFDQANPTSGTVTTANKAMFLAQYSLDFDFNWVNAIDNGFSQGQEMSVNPTNGAVVITGDFSETLDFDPSVNVADLTAAGNSTDAYWVAYDNNGGYLESDKFGGSDNSETGNYIKFQSDGKIVWFPSFVSSQVSYTTTTGTTSLTNGGLWDVAILKYNESIITSMFESKMATESILIYPVPASDIITVESNINSGTYQIVNGNGILLKNGTYDNKKFEINLSGLTKGIAAIILNGEQVKKIIIK